MSAWLCLGEILDISNFGKLWILLIGLDTTKDLSNFGDSSNFGGEMSGKIRSSWSQSAIKKSVKKMSLSCLLK